MSLSIDARILSALRRAGPRFISRVELSEELDVSASILSDRIEELRAVGYEIEAIPHQGYRLAGTPDILHADDLAGRMTPAQLIGRDIRVFQETSSTSDIVEKLARDGVKEGAVVFAETQTRGRGRLGRRWHSPPGQGLWFSVLLRPPLRPLAATQLTVAAATATARAIEEVAGLVPEIKWPNDILIRQRKVAGILTELKGELDQIRYVILGIGVDVNVEEFPSELRSQATSLKLELGRPVDRAELASAILRELDQDYARLCQGRFEVLAAEWEARCRTIGRAVVIQMGNRQIEGQAEALDENGALLVRTPHGHLERIVGGDVAVEK